ncbi:MAG: Hsp20/alpha crystallin family protein [Candidatus Nomurabacteria bacterium]|jgi:HSP20 family protein|nr:Hsp20/alpha crystallin family protein [Candidatus Nomurabacteria bacterium]
MARKQADEMSLDDELAAAFLEGDDTGLAVEEEVVETSVSAPVVVQEETESNEDEWADDTDEFPGQLAVDMYETNDKLIVKARTAGIERKDLDVSISDNILSISGVLNGGEDDRATQWHIQECYWGEFSRTIALPVQIKEDGVDAVLKDGVLTISFEKEKVEAPKKITIN